MIAGTVDSDGLPVIPLPLTDQVWRATVDTGFNGDLELPEALRVPLNPRFVGRTRFMLAGGQSLVEDTFLVNFPFDDEMVLAEATFSAANEILVGTGMLRRYRLQINFPDRIVALERVC